MADKKAEREDVLNDYKLSGSITITARKFGISPQRVYQIANNRRVIPFKTQRKVHLLGKRECLLCGSKEKLEIHHEDLDGSNNNIDNLVLLCRGCHVKTHTYLRNF